MILRLASGSALAGERGEEALARVDVHERDVVVAAEQRDDLLGLVLAQQAVVDEDAGELVADRLVDQHRRHRGIDAAGQPADDAAVADLRRGCARSRSSGRRPWSSRRPARDLVHEVGEQLAAARRVHDLRVELHAVEPARLVGDRRERRALETATTRKPGGSRVDAVAVAHPDLSRAPFGQKPSNSGESSTISM